MFKINPPKPSDRRRRHSRKYAPSPEELPERLDKKKQEKKVERKPPPEVSELLGSYFVTGGRAGGNTRAELRTIEREVVESEATRPRDPKPGEVIFKEPPRPEALRRERIKTEQVQAERLRETLRREEGDGIYRRHEAERQGWEHEHRRQQEEIRKYQAELERVKYERQFETLRQEHEDMLRRNEAELQRREADIVRKHEAREAELQRRELAIVRKREVREAELRRAEREREVEVQGHEGERRPHQVQVDYSEHQIVVQEHNPRSESRRRSRHGTDSDSDDRPSDQPEPRSGLRGGGPSGGGRYRNDNARLEPEDLIYIFYVRYGEIKEIPTRLSPRRLGGIGRWTDKDLLTHLVEGYRRQGGNGKWWTWRYWWDSFMKEIAALILIQMEESRVIYERTPYPGQREQPPITDLRRQVKRSIDLFGGKEASGQFRYLIRHYKRRTDNSRIITSQIDRLTIWAQQAHAETEHYKYYLLLQVVEGQNGQAFLLGILIIILCFLAFGLALGATQASSISWGDVFSISGFGLAALSGLFALMALAQYLGLEDMNPGNPISRSASED
ncbi:uncharacterized protein PV07_09221 [Cladophialophora immunda]|uniref:Uncharacterized protein n=1 Tax=Cladophialophora immunda TaxID=569365 RepID=A0A0D2CR71_9EURO|nr:uncharacterized protein PV07_09221 [Cladophialophora immunda]KIW26094.1 hypothetical protein PV07_09221 [Cladophialophora immunda]